MLPHRHDRLDRVAHGSAASSRTPPREKRLRRSSRYTSLFTGDDSRTPHPSFFPEYPALTASPTPPPSLITPQSSQRPVRRVDRSTHDSPMLDTAAMDETPAPSPPASDESPGPSPAARASTPAPAPARSEDASDESPAPDPARSDDVPTPHSPRESFVVQSPLLDSRGASVNHTDPDVFIGSQYYADTHDLEQHHADSADRQTDLQADPQADLPARVSPADPVAVQTAERNQSVTSRDPGDDDDVEEYDYADKGEVSTEMDFFQHLSPREEVVDLFQDVEFLMNLEEEEDEVDGECVDMNMLEEDATDNANPFKSSNMRTCLRRLRRIVRWDVMIALLCLDGR